MSQREILGVHGQALTQGEPIDGLRTIGQRAGLDRKTVRRYLTAAQAAGLSREAGIEAITDALVGQVLEAVRPVEIVPREHLAVGSEAQSAAMPVWLRYLQSCRSRLTLSWRNGSGFIRWRSSTRRWACSTTTP